VDCHGEITAHDLTDGLYKNPLDAQGREPFMELLDVSRDLNGAETGVEDFIRIEDLGYSGTGQTKVWRIFNSRYSQAVGLIKWHFGLRRYCFFPEEATCYDHDSLRLLSEFAEAQMQVKMVRGL
jgi:hypothetical protein